MTSSLPVQITRRLEIEEKIAQLEERIASYRGILDKESSCYIKMLGGGFRFVSETNLLKENQQLTKELSKLKEELALLTEPSIEESALNNPKNAL